MQEARVGHTSAHDTSVNTSDDDVGGSQAILLPQRNGALAGALNQSAAEDPLVYLAQALADATAGEAWDVAKGILRQIERIELARAGNVKSIDDARARRRDGRS